MCSCVPEVLYIFHQGPMYCEDAQFTPVGYSNTIDKYSILKESILVVTCKVRNYCNLTMIQLYPYRMLQSPSHAGVVVS